MLKLFSESEHSPRLTVFHPDLFAGEETEAQKCFGATKVPESLRNPTCLQVSAGRRKHTPVCWHCLSQPDQLESQPWGRSPSGSAWQGQDGDVSVALLQGSTI